MKNSPFATALLASALLAGLGGCAHFPQKFASLFSRAKPIPANIGQVGPYAAEDRLYADAAKAIDRRNYGEALDLLQVARDSRPSDPRVLTAMAVVYDKLGRFDLSDRYYDKAEQADPGSRIVAMDRRYSMMLRNAGQAAQRMDSEPVLAQVEPVVRPSTATASHRAGRVLLVADGHGVAHMTPQPIVQHSARAATPAPVLSPTDKLYAGGVAAIQKHEYGEAIGILRQARDLSPSDARVLTALGVTYDHLGRFDLSNRYYDQAQRIDPDSEVLAQDRRTSQMLQQHGGFAGPDDVVVLAGAAQKTPTMNLAKAPVRSRHGA